MKTKQSLKTSPLKGCPQSHWPGKRPLDVVGHYPAQWCESVGVEAPPAETPCAELAWHDDHLLFHGDKKRRSIVDMPGKETLQTG